MLKKEARRITGGLSDPGKMPEGSYNLPTSACQTGQILAKVEGTPCSGCYADDRGRYRFPNVKAALKRRLASLTHPQWVEGMITLVKKIKHLRWTISACASRQPSQLGIDNGRGRRRSI